MNHARTTIGEIVADDYRASKVFEKYGIDFCCGGNVLLVETCADKGLAVGEILKELEAVTAGAVPAEQDFGSWDLPRLADHIIKTHHSYLNENTAPILGYAKKIAGVHGENHPELFEIAATFEMMATGLSEHLRAEEEVFFPAVRRVVAATNIGRNAESGDVRVLEKVLASLNEEHEEIGEGMHLIRHLSNGFLIPEDGCNTFAVTYEKLREFEEDLHRHVHLENNILFRKALQQ
ncbi:MAG: iron-sulfur cluster repair di-iron protein [Bdellovibrionales bacterium GWB1_55_8]|nr:MAG: iron-sulfur cluster repair di-iron protein [Bdellovibrionales bacterium GWB1_55_8]